MLFRLKKHRQLFAQREKEIQEQKIRRLKFNEINVELRKIKLENDYKKCVKIKETLLPVEDLTKDTVFPVLTDEQEAIVAQVFSKYGDDGEILAKKFSLNIARRDLKTLGGLNWLNDEVINFYMNLIMERGNLPKFPKVYAMNTFFYPKLVKDGHSSVRRWTRKVDIFAHDIIVVPIHLRMHWCMAIIDFRNQEINYYDSMGTPNRVCLESLIKYLQEEHLDKKNCNYDTSNWSLTNMKDIPQQMNGSDCGMFSCTFAEFLSRDAKITFSQDDMPYLRRKMIVEIIQGRLLID